MSGGKQIMLDITALKAESIKYAVSDLTEPSLFGVVFRSSQMGEKIKLYRRIIGISQEDLVKGIKVDP